MNKLWVFEVCTSNVTNVTNPKSLGVSHISHIWHTNFKSSELIYMILSQIKSKTLEVKKCMDLIEDPTTPNSSLF